MTSKAQRDALNNQQFKDIYTEIARQVKGGAEDHDLPSALYAPQPQADAGVMYADYLAELTPAGLTVWEWRSWEHLDPVADGIAEVQALRTLWAMGNSILELPDSDILGHISKVCVRPSNRPGNDPFPTSS